MRGPLMATVRNDKGRRVLAGAGGMLAPLSAVMIAISGPTWAQGTNANPPAGGSTRLPAALKPGEAKPYDDKLMRLSEILGAIHYLRELCGQNDRQLWRERMRDLIEMDAGSARRRALLSQGFNKGYRDYGRTYQSCTPAAQTVISRFLAEGAQIADGLAKTTP
jgi:uncharacterized protein (TIGR02301 family)